MVPIHREGLAGTPDPNNSYRLHYRIEVLPSYKGLAQTSVERPGLADGSGVHRVLTERESEVKHQRVRCVAVPRNQTERAFLAVLTPLPYPPSRFHSANAM